MSKPESQFPTIADLLKRLEGATGGDRELDFAIDGLFNPRPPATTGHEDVKLPPGFGKDPISMAMDPRPRYTSSIDAALGLVERVLPGVWWLLSRGKYRPDEPLFGVHLLREGYDPDSSEEPISVGEASTAPLAILIALLRAIRTKDLNDGKR